MPSTTVPISQPTRDLLRRCADETGQSMQAILEHAVEAYRRRLVLERTNAAFAALREQPEAWQVEQADREVWEATLTDSAANRLRFLLNL